MLIVVLLSAGLVIACVGLHLFTLRALSGLLPRHPSLTRMRVGIVILGAIVGHLVEMALFALALAALLGTGDFGALRGELEAGFRDYYYYSAVTFTSLGYGDLTPVGPIRLLCAVEALTGLVLITWTASFVFLAMERAWIPRD